MEIKKLEELFYTENTHLKEVLDKDKSGQWNANKTRGYGIVVCEHKGLKFGIPLRSHINHRFCFITSDNKGLDFTKAVLLSKDDYISTTPFKIPNDEHTKIVDGAANIRKKFSKYVENYLRGMEKADDNILRPYKYSTLQNYHRELGLES